MGFLVEAFWDRGVSCDGIDISEYAISQVRQDVQSYCHSRSLVEPITDQHDLITCIEVLEHMQDFDARLAIGNLCKASDVILFSSSPNDFSEPTHVNVRPPAYWLAQFAENGFYPDAFFDASFLTPHAMLLRRSTPDQVAYQKLFADYIRARSGLQSQAEVIAGLNPSRQHAIEEQRSIAVQRTEELNARVRDLNARLVEAQEALDSDRAISDRIVARLQAEVSAAVAERRELINHRDALVQVERSRINDLISRLEGILNTQVERGSAHEENLRGMLGAFIHQNRSRTSEILNRLNSLCEKPAPDPSEIVRTSKTKVLKRPAIWLQHQREIRALRKSVLFDPAWYLAQYPDVTQQGVDPLIHYVEKGASERRNPSASFDTNWYVTTYPDVLRSSINPLVHFVTLGSIEGRLPKPPADSGNDEEDCEDIQSIKSSEWFDGDWYTSEYPDVAGDGCDPAEHFLLYGASEGRNPSPRFDTKWYLATYPDVAVQGSNPLLHFIHHGHQEGRLPCPPIPTSPGKQSITQLDQPDVDLIRNSSYFDAEWYVEQYPEVTNGDLDPAEHYLVYGFKGRCPGCS